MYSHRVNSPKNLAKYSGNTSSNIFSCIRGSANTGPACIRAKINSPRCFSCMYWFCAGGLLLQSLIKMTPLDSFRASGWVLRRTQLRERRTLPKHRSCKACLLKSNCDALFWGGLLQTLFIWSWRCICQPLSRIGLVVSFPAILPISRGYLLCLNPLSDPTLWPSLSQVNAALSAIGGFSSYTVANRGWVGH